MIVLDFQSGVAVARGAIQDGCYVEMVERAVEREFPYDGSTGP